MILVFIQTAHLVLMDLTKMEMFTAIAVMVYILGFFILFACLVESPFLFGPSPIMAFFWPLMLLKHMIEEFWKYFSRWNFKS